MKGNEIIADIHRHRERVARVCGYDVKKLMDYYRKRERSRTGAGHELVSYVSAESAPLALREEHPKKQRKP